MCIRDSVNGDAPKFLYKGFHLACLLSRSADCDALLATVDTRVNGIANELPFISVSYTHLDVYKRQTVHCVLYDCGVVYYNCCIILL